MLQLATPFIEREVAKILLEIANKIVRGLDYDEMFPLK